MTLLFHLCHRIERSLRCENYKGTLQRQAQSGRGRLSNGKRVHLPGVRVVTVVIGFDVDPVRLQRSHPAHIKMRVHDARFSMFVVTGSVWTGRRVNVLKGRDQERQRNNQACLDRQCETHH